MAETKSLGGSVLPSHLLARALCSSTRGPHMGFRPRSRTGSCPNMTSDGGKTLQLDLVTHRPISPDFQKGLKDRVILCTLMNKPQPGLVPEINSSMKN